MSIYKPKSQGGNQNIEVPNPQNRTKVIENLSNPLALSRSSPGRSFGLKARQVNTVISP